MLVIEMLKITNNLFQLNSFQRTHNFSYDIPQTLTCEERFSRHNKHFFFSPKNLDVVVVDYKNLSSLSSFKKIN